MVISKVLSSVLHGNINFCCLCLQQVGKTAVYSEDVVFVDTYDTCTMSDVLASLFGESTVSAATFGLFCEKCKVSSVKSYRFMKMCKENSHYLISAIDSVYESVDNTTSISELDHYKTLYVSLDLNDFTSKQLYDDQALNSSSKAFRRFNIISNTAVKPKIETRDIYLNSTKSWMKKEKSPTKILMHRKKPKIHDLSTLYDIPSVPTLHLLADSNNPTNYTCKGCLTKLPSENKLRLHYFEKHYPRDVKCPKCPRNFISEEMLSHHMEKFDSVGICSECGKHFSDKYVLQKHEINHNFQITCAECGRLYRSMEAYRKHFTDDVCRQKMKKSAEQALYECDHCHKRYCYKPYLAKHIMYEHGNKKGFRCEFCNKQFYTQSRLKTHLVKHTREKNFVCSICAGRFVTRESLIYHTRLHTGEKPYPCEYCNEAFLNASRRLDHVRRHHLAPSLECNICNTKFKSTGSLLKHKKRHSNPNSRLNTQRMYIPNLENTSEVWILKE